MNKPLRKGLAVACAGIMALPGMLSIPLKIIHNVMSHTGYQTEANTSWLKTPSSYLTQGNYKGFVDTITYEGDECTQTNPEIFSPDPLHKLDASKRDIDLNAIYLRLQKNPLQKSKFKPTKLSNADNEECYSLSDFILKPENLTGDNLHFSSKSLEKILNMKEGEVLSPKELGEENPRFFKFTNVDLHEYTLSFGRDKQGIFSSVYDVWDFKPNSGFFKERSHETAIKLAGELLPKIGKPIQFYDRIYWSNTGANEVALRASLNGENGKGYFYVNDNHYGSKSNAGMTKISL